MESIKSQMKMPILLDLHFLISKISKDDNNYFDKAVEAGSFVCAQFMRSISKNKIEKNGDPSLTKEEVDAIFDIIIEFFSNNFKSHFKQDNFQFLTQKAMEILSDSNSEKVISEYFLKMYQ